MANEISKNKDHYWELKHQTLGIDHLILCYINELAQELLDNISSFIMMLNLVEISLY